MQVILNAQESRQLHRLFETSEDVVRLSLIDTPQAVVGRAQMIERLDQMLVEAQSMLDVLKTAAEYGDAASVVVEPAVARQDERLNNIFRRPMGVA